jgi:hypothetical protein
MYPLEVSSIRNDDATRRISLEYMHEPCDSPRLALNRLNQKCSDVLAVSVEYALEILDVVVPDRVHLAVDFDTWSDVFQERTEFAPRIGIGRHA